MSWEAFRWTAKSPSELYHVLGPHGVDDLVRQMVAAVWRDLPADGRSFAAAVAAARQVFDRNIAVWRAIKKPGPEAFFADLQPHQADGFLRQAMVLTWMMMPRTGGRDVTDALQIVSDVFERNLRAWDDDNDTFTGAKKLKAKEPKAKQPRAGKPKAGGGAKEAPARTPAKPKRVEAKGVRAMAQEKRGSGNGGAARPGKAAGPKKGVSRVEGAGTAKDDEVAPLRAEMDRNLKESGKKSKVARSG